MNRRWTWGEIVAAVALALFACAVFGLAASYVHAAEAPTFKRGFHPATVRIIDGDTIAVGKTHYRLYGYDTPELSVACQKDRAIVAKGQLEALLAPPNRLILRVVTNRSDKYGRTIAAAFTGKSGTRDVSALMIAKGAHPYDGETKQPWEGC